VSAVPQPEFFHTSTDEVGDGSWTESCGGIAAYA
jgi:hypothetical protein